MLCAYIGLGEMGIRMAGNISNKLKEMNYPPLIVHNRTRRKAEELKKTHSHIEIRDNLEGIKADVIFTCLLNDQAVNEVIEKLLPSLNAGTILVEQSTIDPAEASKLSKKVESKGAIYIACPIMGPPVKAASGDLILLLSGNKAARDKVVPIIHNVIGKKIIDMGEDVSKALKLKLCGNFFIFGLVEMIAEGLTLGESAGVGQEKVAELLSSVFPNSLLNIYAERMVNETYKDQIAFPLGTAKKDALHIKSMGEAANASTPLLELFLNNLNGVHSRDVNYDMSSIVGELREKANLDFDLKK